MQSERFTPNVSAGACQSKLSHRDLQMLLARSSLSSNSEHDAAEIAIGDTTIYASVDLISPFCSDPAVFGNVAFVHSLADICASFASPVAALAVVEIGERDASKHAMDTAMSAASATATRLGCKIVGGHTIRARTSRLGFCVLGVPFAQTPSPTAPSAECAIILTKPLGLSHALALHDIAPMEAIERVRALLLADDIAAARILVAHGATAATDISGFGLALHLRNLALRAHAALHIELSAIPAACPALHHIGESFCLWRSNCSSIEQDLVIAPSAVPMLPLLGLPAAAGGLAALIPKPSANSCLAALRGDGYAAAEIGHARFDVSPSVTFS